MTGETPDPSFGQIIYSQRNRNTSSFCCDFFFGCSCFVPSFSLLPDERRERNPPLDPGILLLLRWTRHPETRGQTKRKNNDPASSGHLICRDLIMCCFLWLLLPLTDGRHNTLTLVSDCMCFPLCVCKCVDGDRRLFPQSSLSECLLIQFADISCRDERGKGTANGRQQEANERRCSISLSS